MELTLQRVNFLNLLTKKNQQPNRKRDKGYKLIIRGQQQKRNINGLWYSTPLKRNASKNTIFSQISISKDQRV